MSRIFVSQTFDDKIIFFCRRLLKQEDFSWKLIAKKWFKLYRTAELGNAEVNGRQKIKKTEIEKTTGESIVI